MRSSAATTTLKVLAALFFTYHMVAVTFAGLVPRRSALSKELFPHFRPYLLTTGNNNTWRMFIDRPVYRRFNVVLAVETEQGKKMRLGPILPGLLPYDQSLRALKVFHSYDSKRYRRYRRWYLESAKRQIKRMQGRAPKSIELRYEADKLNALDTIRRGGKLTTHKSWRRGS